MVFSLFHVKDRPKLHVIWPPEPSSHNVLFQGQPPRNKDSSGKTYTLRTRIQTCARVLSVFQKQQTCELVARHSVPRYELVDLLFFNG